MSKWEYKTKFMPEKVTSVMSYYNIPNTTYSNGKKKVLLQCTFSSNFIMQESSSQRCLSSLRFVQLFKKNQEYYFEHTVTSESLVIQTIYHKKSRICYNMIMQCEHTDCWNNSSLVIIVKSSALQLTKCCHLFRYN